MDSAQRTPGKCINHYFRVPLTCLLDQPPFVTLCKVPIGYRARIAGFRAVGQVRIGTNLNLQMLQRCPYFGFKR